VNARSSTVGGFAEQFLDFRFPEAADDPGKISASDIARFLQARVVLRAPRDKTVPSHLRNFFRYLFRAGKISTNLANAVPRMAQRFAAGAVLLEVETGFMPDRAMTGHAEGLLATQASKKFGADFSSLGCSLGFDQFRCARLASS
jgi:hypothetical protein